MLPPREELMTMPLTILEHINIENPNEEKIVQEVLEIRREKMPFVPEIYRDDVKQARIETPEQEKEWQKIIDERVAKARPKAVVAGVVENPTTQELVPERPLETELVEDEPVQEEVAIKRFCEFCESKGGRHKLNCSRPKG